MFPWSGEVSLNFRDQNAPSPGSMVVVHTSKGAPWAGHCWNKKRGWDSARKYLFIAEHHRTARKIPDGHFKFTWWLLFTPGGAQAETLLRYSLLERHSDTSTQYGVWPTNREHSTLWLPPHIAKSCLPPWTCAWLVFHAWTNAPFSKGGDVDTRDEVRDRARGFPAPFWPRCRGRTGRWNESLHTADSRWSSRLLSAGEEGTLRRALRGARGLESGPPHIYYILLGIVFRPKIVTFTGGVSLILVSLKRGRL